MVVRAAFFDAIAHRPADQPVEDFVAAAGGHDYAVWFREIEARRFRPWLLDEPAALRADYEERVRKAVQTYASFAASGWDRRYPVTLRSVKASVASDSGVTTARRLHVGDGGHRLALLLRTTAELEPAAYRVDPRPRPVLDNTAILLRHLRVDDEAYLRFLAPGYTEQVCADLDELERVVADETPSRLGELRQVVDVHTEARAVHS